MSCTRSILTVVGLAAIAGSIALAQPAKDKKPTTPAPAAAQPGEMQLPPGMTKEDMQACMEAGTPGPNHKFLADAVGVWAGKSTMWMTPQAEPMKSECTSTITSIMDGRFTKCESSGDMPGMGPFNGFGLYGYDNVAKKFQSTWIDNCGTTMMQGTGELSSDGKTLTWNYTGTCPIQKKPIVVRQIETRNGKDSMTLTMYGPDKTGKEFKMMEIVFTRRAGSASAEKAK